jgi:hypothetical protein
VLHPGRRRREGLVSVPEDGGVGDHGGDDVGVHVGRRPAVLEVALAVLLGSRRPACDYCT